MKGDRQWLKDFVLRSDGASYEYDCCVKILRFGKDRLGTYAKVCIEEDGEVATGKGTKIRRVVLFVIQDIVFLASPLPIASSSNPIKEPVVDTDVVLLDQGKGLLPSVCVHPSDLFSLLYA